VAEFFYRSGPNEFGPLTSSELKRLILGGRLSAGDEVRRGRHGNWVPAASVPGFFSQPYRGEERAINEMDVVTEGASQAMVEPVEAERDTAVDSEAGGGEGIVADARKRAEHPQSAPADRHDALLVPCAIAIAGICYFTSLAGLVLGLLSLFSEQTLDHQIYTGLCFLFALVGLVSGCALNLLLAIHRGQRPM